MKLKDRNPQLKAYYDIMIGFRNKESLKSPIQCECQGGESEIGLLSHPDSILCNADSVSSDNETSILQSVSYKHC